MQLVAARASEYVPPAHGVHASCPGMLLYCPGEHGMQLSALAALGTGIRVPAGQSIPAARPLLGQTWPLGHGVHCEAAVKLGAAP